MRGPIRHSSAVIEQGAIVSESARIWHDVHIREGARIGDYVSVGKGAYIDQSVAVGPGTKIQNYACLYAGVDVGPHVFIGPHACFTNDRYPRAVGDWTPGFTLVQRGASIGANATIVCPVSIGKFAMIGAGCVVTEDVPDYGKVIGNPSRLVGFVCERGHALIPSEAVSDAGWCHRCAIAISGLEWAKVEPRGRC